jgi:hypothetical protein
MGSSEPRDTAGVNPAGSWTDGALVDRLITGDSLAALLELPRRIAASLVRESGIDVRRVVDVGAGTGAFLRELLEEFAEADGVWVDASDAMLERARTSLADLGPRVTFAIGDLSPSPSHSPVTWWCPPGRSTTSGPRRSNASTVPLPMHSPPAASSSTSTTSRRREIGGTATERSDRRSLAAPPEPPAPTRTTLPRSPWTTTSVGSERPGSRKPDVPWRFFWTALVVTRTTR